MKGAESYRDSCQHRVALVDDHPLFARALEGLVRTAGDLVWLGARATVKELLAAFPDVEVAVLDLRLADGTTPCENAERLRVNDVKVLVCTSGEHPELLRSAARAGVDGVVLKSEPEATVLDAIRSVARGDVVHSTEWAAAIDGDPDLAAVDLSPQQQRVLTRYASGETTKSIARHLGIGVDTVNDYLNRIRLKYAEAGRPTPSKLDFYKRALEDGWLPFPTRRKSGR